MPTHKPKSACPEARLMSIRRRLAVAVIALAALLPVTACLPSDANGTVTARIHRGKWRYLVIQADGRTVKFRVGLFDRAWRHCHVGDPYPQCGLPPKQGQEA